MSISFEVVVFLVLLALAFDFLNGFHDAANSIATIVSTGAMSPHWAVAWAAFFNFVAFLVFGFAVATTIGKRSEEHTSELQSLTNLVCRLLLEKKKKTTRLVRDEQ